jgi:hypothetical protein
MLPEDFTLRRHYLTDLKFKQDAQFEDFIAVAMGTKTVKNTEFPVTQNSISTLHYVLTGLFVFLLFVLF